MSLQVRNSLIGIGVAFVVGFGLMFAGGGMISIVPAMVLGMFAWYVLSNLANNRKMQSVPDAERDAMLASPPAAGSGLLYVYREGFMGRALGVDVLVDGQQVAQLKSPMSTRLALSAGSHTLAAGPRGFAGAQNKGAAVTFTLGEGETVVFALGFRAGMTQNTVTLDRTGDVPAAIAKLRTIPMIAPESPSPMPIPDGTFGQPGAPG